MGFGQIATWMPGAVDPIAEIKEVIWRPDTAATVIKVGQPVCYDSDALHDAEEKTTNPSSLGATYAEGNQTYVGRLFCVEEPQSDNLQAFAGIVAKLGPLAGADGDRIQIFVPKDGAVVPVYANVYCYADRTILGIRASEADVGYPGMPIGIALEDIDRSGGSADGMTWMRFKKFAYDNQNEQLEIDDEATTNTVVPHRINIISKQTGGRFTAFEVKAESANGVYSSYKGLAAYFESTISATVANHANSVGVHLNITGGTPSEYLSALQVKLYESGATLSSISRLSVLHLTHQVAQAPQTNRFGWILLTQDGAEASDAMILATNLATLPAVAFTGDITVGSTGGDYAIKVYLQSQPGTQQWYIPLVKRLS